ncbi:5036_t:CDS:2, partial [Cetraspora pellucida]
MRRNPFFLDAANGKLSRRIHPTTALFSSLRLLPFITITRLRNAYAGYLGKPYPGLISSIKSIIEENTQQSDAEKWIDAIDKNFNSLRKM